MASFFETITAAIKDFSEHGFDSIERLQYWTKAIRDAAIASLVPEHNLTDTLQRTFERIYKDQVSGGKILNQHKGIERFTVERLQPILRAELDRRMMVSRNLIKMNREAMVEKTVQRFSGWASSVPAGGSRAVETKEVKEDLKKALVSLPFEERRVHIDQGAKFLASLNDIVATNSGALAGKWHSQWRRRGYHYREDHKERDEKIYVVRGNWALEKGLMKVGPDGYTDQITKPAEEVYCSCSYIWLYSLRDLPDDMLTQKGKAALAEAREQIKRNKQPR